jgi:hypothetical protein
MIKKEVSNITQQGRQRSVVFWLCGIDKHQFHKRRKRFQIFHKLFATLAEVLPIVLEGHQDISETQFRCGTH